MGILMTTAGAFAAVAVVAAWAVLILTVGRALMKTPSRPARQSVPPTERHRTRDDFTLAA